MFIFIANLPFVLPGYSCDDCIEKDELQGQFEATFTKIGILTL